MTLHTRYVNGTANELCLQVPRPEFPKFSENGFLFLCRNFLVTFHSAFVQGDSTLLAFNSLFRSRGILLPRVTQTFSLVFCPLSGVTYSLPAASFLGINNVISMIVLLFIASTQPCSYGVDSFLVMFVQRFRLFHYTVT